MQEEDRLAQIVSESQAERQEPPRTESQRLRRILETERQVDGPDLHRFTDDNFVDEALNVQGRLVVIDFWADYYVPCQIMRRSMQKLQTELPAVKFGRVDVSQNNDLVKAFSLKAIPHVAVLLDGEVVAEAVGVKSCDELRKMIGPFVEKIKSRARAS